MAVPQLLRGQRCLLPALLLCFAFGAGLQVGLIAFRPAAGANALEPQPLPEQPAVAEEPLPVQPQQPQQPIPQQPIPQQPIWPQQPDPIEEQPRIDPVPKFEPQPPEPEPQQPEPQQPPKQTVSVVFDEVMNSDEVQRLLGNAKRKLQSLADSSSPLISYLRRGERLPVLLLTCNRPELLKQTLQSLLQTGVDPNDIVVVQDGALESVAEIVRSHNLHLKQNTQPNQLRGGAANDGAARIATNYKFALTYAFEVKPEAPAFIIVEDDLLFSPDFYEYFHENAPLLEVDSSTMILSAWNDNGFRTHVRDKFQFHRTDFFPGLGWLMTRQLYKGELEQIWPTTHWDHWLRDPKNHRERESIYPQVPRDFHNGIRGTFMDDRTHNKYFKDIANNQDPSLSWQQERVSTGYPPYLLATKDVYEARVTGLISRCTHIRDVQELVTNEDTVLCVWIDVSPHSHLRPPPFEKIGNFFGIWHEIRRGNYRGVHEFYWKNDNYILLINSSDSPFARFKPHDVNNINVREFNPSALQRLNL